LPTTNKAEWGCVTVNEKKYHGIQKTRRFSTEITPLTRINVGRKREKLKESLDRLWSFQEVEAPGIPKQSAHKVCKVVSPKHQPTLPPGNIPGTHFC
jgi:hypothetical protein